MSTETVPAEKQSYLLPITVIGILFFVFGFFTWLNGILIPLFRTACELNDFQIYFVTFAFYISYFVMALPSSAVLKRTGFRNGMTIGLWIMTVGALLFVPAAYARSFGLFLTGLFVLGTGLALLQTAVNPYITIIGPRDRAAQRISIMGIANKVAGAIAPIILASYVLKDSMELETPCSAHPSRAGWQAASAPRASGTAAEGPSASPARPAIGSSESHRTGAARQNSSPACK